MRENQTCPKCGTALRQDTAPGLCPNCLFELALDAVNLPTMDSATVSYKLRLLDPGQRFGGYVVQRLLGRGGMGEVYEAEEAETGRRIALKLIAAPLASDEHLQRFLREGRLAAAINHPNSTYVYGSEEIDGIAVIAMELLPGRTLADRVKENGSLPVREAVDAILQVIAGLEAALSRGILHRDVKPSNCFVGEGGVVKVGDFGLSIPSFALREPQVTSSDSFLGTPSFASPEQIRGKALDVRSDIYSVASTLYYLLTGKVPFYETNLMRLAALIVSERPVSPSAVEPDVPPALSAVILKCLEKEPKDRIGSYAELREQLTPFGTTKARPASAGIRFAAAYLDFLFMAPLGVLASRTVGAAGIGLVLFAYYFLLEGWYSASLGKRIFRLRVCAEDGTPASRKVVLVRAVLFAAFFAIPALLPSQNHILEIWTTFVSLDLPFPIRLAIGFSQFLRRFVFVRFNWLQVTVFAALVGSERIWKSYAHDRLSHTLVVRVPRQVPKQTASESARPAIQTSTLERLGPYQVTDVVRRSEWADLLVGWDERLQRNVWIERASGEPMEAFSTPRNLNRRGRLRWLGGRRTAAEAWNAYEFVEGTPVSQLRNSAQSWERVRTWMLDLAEEFHAASADGSLPATLGFDQIWVTDDGLKVVDLKSVRDRALDSTRVPVSTATAAQAFLHSAAVALLGGPNLNVVLPLSARTFIERLHSHPATSLGPVVAQLRALGEEDASVNPAKRRALLYAVGAVPAILLLVSGVRDIARSGLGGLPTLAEIGYFAAMVNLTFFLVGVVSCASAILVRGGLLLKLFGLQLVDRRGTTVSRTRVALRAAISWSPMFTQVFVVGFPMSPSVSDGVVAIFLLAIFGIGACISASRPAGGLQDWIAGTRLVPL